LNMRIPPLLCYSDGSLTGGLLIGKRKFHAGVRPSTVSGRLCATLRRSCRVGKGGSTTSPRERPLVRRAHALLHGPVTRGHGARETFMNGYAVPPPLPTLRALCRENILCQHTKGYRPLLRFSGPEGRPSLLIPHPSQSKGMARRQGAARIAPGWNSLGVKRHAPRLAARQRGICHVARPLPHFAPCGYGGQCGLRRCGLIFAISHSRNATSAASSCRNGP